MSGQWSVLLEATPGTTPAASSRSLAPQPGLAPPGISSASTFSSGDRYVVRLLVQADGPLQALRTARRVWGEAAGEAGQGVWELVRTEIKDVAELAGELRPSRSVEEARVWAASTDPGDHEAVQAAYEATRQLLWIESPSEAAPILASLLTRLGGRVAATGDADALPFDVPVTERGSSGSIRPAAPTGSPARRRLISVMPAVSADATRAVRLAERSYRERDPRRG